jgi:molybdopterin/thiamine biosynthesis adenylyltransferase
MVEWTEEKIEELKQDLAKAYHLDINSPAMEEAVATELLKSAPLLEAYMEDPVIEGLNVNEYPHVFSEETKKEIIVARDYFRGVLAEGLVRGMALVLKMELEKRIGEGKTDIDLHGLFDNETLLDLRETAIKALCERAKEVDPKFVFRRGTLNAIVFNRVDYQIPSEPETRPNVESEDYQTKLQGIFTALQLEKIKSLHPVIIGAGATGANAAHFFARLGIRGITLIDPDVFEPSNIGRTPFCDVNSIGMKKVEVVKENLEKINPYLSIETHDEKVSFDLLEKVCGDKEFLHDACHDPEARALVHRFGRENKKICFTTACFGKEGRFTTFFPEDPYWEEVFDSTRRYTRLNIHPLLPALLAAERVNTNIKILTGVGDIIRYPYILTVNLFRKNPFIIRRLTS